MCFFVCKCVSFRLRPRIFRFASWEWMAVTKTIFIFSVPCHYIYLRRILHPTLGSKTVLYLIISVHTMDIDLWSSITFIKKNYNKYHRFTYNVLSNHIIFSIILYKSCDVVDVILCFDKLENQAIDIINGLFIALHKSFI